MKYTIPLGTSEPQDFALKDDGASFDASGYTLALEIARKIAGGTEAVTSPPTVAWLNQTGSTVRVSGVERLTLGSYFVRFKLTDGGGKVGFVPNGEKADLWHVVAVAAW
jgi:hypothetical protein